MRISVRRTGGFAGVDEAVADIDTGALGASAAGNIEQQVRAADFFDLPPQLSAGEVGADQMQRVVTITAGDKTHTVAYTEVPEGSARAAKGDVERVEEIVKRVIGGP